MSEVKDRNGVVIKKGQTVTVHPTHLDTWEAEVTETFPDDPTICEPGYWVGIKGVDGVEKMPSYVLEVIE